MQTVPEIRNDEIPHLRVGHFPPQLLLRLGDVKIAPRIPEKEVRDIHRMLPVDSIRDELRNQRVNVGLAALPHKVREPCGALRDLKRSIHASIIFLALSENSGHSATIRTAS